MGERAVLWCRNEYALGKYSGDFAVVCVGLSVSERDGTGSVGVG